MGLSFAKKKAVISEEEVGDYRAAPANGDSRD